MVQAQTIEMDDQDYDWNGSDEPGSWQNLGNIPSGNKPYVSEPEIYGGGCRRL